MKRKLPWYKRNPGKFLMATRDLSLEERGAYNDILELLYYRGRPIPDDQQFLAGFLGVSVRKWNIIRLALLDAEKIILRGDFISQDEFERERMQQQDFVEGQVRWGKLGAQRRKEQRQGELELSGRKVKRSPAKPMTYAKGSLGDDADREDNQGHGQQYQPLSDGLALDDLDDSFLRSKDDFSDFSAMKNARKVDENSLKTDPDRLESMTSPQPARARQKREDRDSKGRDSISKVGRGSGRGKVKTSTARRIPKGWTMGELSDTLETMVADWPQGMLERERDRFLDHAAANGRTAKDWDAAFRNWLRKADDDWRRTRHRHGSGKGWAAVGHRLTG